MKLLKIKLCFCILFLSIIYNNMYVYSQPISCPPSTENWHPSTYNYLIYYYNALGSVDYTYQNSGQGTDIKIDWSTLTIENAPTTKESAWKKVMVLNLVEKIVVNNCPHIDGSPWTVNSYYERQCSTQTKFVYALDVTTQVLCCSDPTISERFYDYWDGVTSHKLMNEYKYVVCGTKCCRRQYNCTIHYDSWNDYWYATIDLIQTFSETTCSGNSSNIDCVTGLPTPCIDGSCDD